MRSIQGPGLFISQFIGPRAPFDTLEGIAGWAAALGFRALQVPTSQPHIFDVAKAAGSDGYCQEVIGILAAHGLEICELNCARAGHLMAVHPAYDGIADEMAPPEARGNPAARQVWAERHLRLAIAASQRLGLRRLASFSGSLLWPYFYPYPPAPDGLVDAGFTELARRWRPLLDECATAGIDLCFELHPGEDLHDGATFERFLGQVDNHPACNIQYDPSHFLLQHMDYLGFIDRYHPRIKSFHVKDAEFNPSPSSGVYGGYQGWVDRPGRFRSLGDGQVDFAGIFSRLTRYDYAGWASLEWECCLKNAQDGAREGAAFIAGHIIKVTERAFDAGMQPVLNATRIATLLGLPKP